MKTYKILLLFLFISVTFAFYFNLTSFFKSPSRKRERVLLRLIKKDKKISGRAVFTEQFAINYKKYIKINDFEKKRLKKLLRSAGIDLSVEAFYMRSIIKSLIILLLVVPAIIILPIIAPVIVVISIVKFFKEIKAPERIMLKNRKLIEAQLPRFANTILQEIKATKDVLGILQRYTKTASVNLKRELDITLSDMRSGNYEIALTRFEARVGGARLSDIIRGLISVVRGDDSVLYFELLAHDLKKEELQNLKMIAQKRPQKINKYSMFMLICMLVMYGFVMAVEIIRSTQKLF